MKSFSITLNGFWDGTGDFAISGLNGSLLTSGANVYQPSSKAILRVGDKGKTIEVKDIPFGSQEVGITVTTPPTTIAYTAGNTFSLTGAVVKVINSDGTMETISNSDITVTPATALATTDVAVTLTYKTFTTKVGVSVTAAP